MHHLHPRSRTTSTLFTTTLFVSFLVVGLPHVLPCPVDQRRYADSEDSALRQQRRRRDVGEDGEKALSPRLARECPVPRPTELVGQVMGTPQREGKGPTAVVVRSLDVKGPKESKDAEHNEQLQGQEGTQ